MVTGETSNSSMIITSEGILFFILFLPVQGFNASLYVLIIIKKHEKGVCQFEKAVCLFS